MRIREENKQMLARTVDALEDALSDALDSEQVGHNNPVRPMVVAAAREELETVVEQVLFRLGL